MRVRMQGDDEGHEHTSTVAHFFVAVANFAAVVFFVTMVRRFSPAPHKM